MIKIGLFGIVFLYVSAYALSSTVLGVAQKLKVPVVILNLQPVAQIDVQQKIEEFDRTFDISPECEATEIERAVRASVALDKLVKTTSSVQWLIIMKAKRATNMKISSIRSSPEIPCSPAEISPWLASAK